MVQAAVRRAIWFHYQVHHISAAGPPRQEDRPLYEGPYVVRCSYPLKESACGNDLNFFAFLSIHLCKLVKDKHTSICEFHASQNTSEP